MSLHPFRVELVEANAFVETLHRHHDPVVGHRFSLGVGLDGRLVGVAICGRPVGRGYNKSKVLEVLRCCTDGTPNACSWLYGAAANCAKVMGFERIVTYTRTDESGTSLKATGWTPELLPLRKDYSFSSSKRTRKPAKGKDNIAKIRWTRVFS